MFPCFVDKAEKSKKPDKVKNQKPIPIKPITENELPTWLSKQTEKVKQWLNSTNFSAEVGTFCLIPDDAGKLSLVLVGVAEENNLLALSELPLTLPENIYCIDHPSKQVVADAMLAWALGAYQFSRYKKPEKNPARLQILDQDAYKAVEHIIYAVYLVRDLINTPTENMHPEDLAAAAVTTAKKFSATVKQIIGDNLLKKNYPAVHTVGRASNHAPRLIDLRWGKSKHPKLTLVGKGVCFDTGGLDLKPPAGMLTMKKDMGGAAHALGLAYLIMAHQLPVNLRVLIPAVENVVAGNAYLPGAVIATRAGTSVEIGNTDAEGRLILADALTEAASENPDLIIDFATLTGAARIALGPDLPALFCNDDDLAEKLQRFAKQQQDLIWRLPIYQPYREFLNSPIADINNSSNNPYGGAITAAVFLQEFVAENKWVHFDLMAWNMCDKPGRPIGGEAQAIRGLFAYLSDHYGK